MKRRLGTALSVLGLLAIGTAAAAVNVRMLQDAGSESAQFQMRSGGDVSPIGSGGNAPGTAALGSVQPSSETAISGSMGPDGLGSVGSMVGRGGRGPHGFGPGDGDRPQPTAAQMMLLRVSAMVRTDPETVRAVARGTQTDAPLLAAIQQAAEAVGTTLKDLAAVADLPPMHGRGHGGPGGDRHERFGVDTATLTYDD